jgi:histidine triad (HIT) family protein
MSSLFTKIISGEVPSYKVYEDEYVYAFLDINPVQPGHTLVVPKNAEIDQFIDLDEVLFDKLMHRVRYVAQLLRAKMNCKRVCVLIEGYNIPHVHIHLVPTNSGEEFDKKFVHAATKEELEEVHKKITS